MNMTYRAASTIFFFFDFILVVVTIITGNNNIMISSFSIAPASPLGTRRSRMSSSRLQQAMERLHNPSSNAFGSLEHLFSLQEIDAISCKIADDEWMALGSVMANTLLETILDVGEDALKQRGWVERMSVSNRIAEEVSSAVKKSIHMIRSQPKNTSIVFDHGQHHLPEELINAMHTLLRHELNTIIAFDLVSDNSPSSLFQYNARDLSILVISSLSKAIESYCGMSNIHAPFFNLFHVMENRINDRRRELLVKHCRGYETVQDVVHDIETSRMTWLRGVRWNR